MREWTATITDPTGEIVWAVGWGMYVLAEDRRAAEHAAVRMFLEPTPEEDDPLIDRFLAGIRLRQEQYRACAGEGYDVSVNPRRGGRKSGR